ncbi:hypothetical protein GGS26DRAFT_596421 [Hypomontagnella submonticulosa]|nr:hypothetical protein GGS26DRAFT_596421 [Hypomontagnella submonticulosa]
MGSLDQTSLNRARDNQRRSRARRREYVQGLERRLKLCETRGIEASREIQMAARRVAEDNQKMRALLNSLGFNNERIGHFLETGNIDLTEITGLDLTANQGDKLRTLELLSTPLRPAQLDLELHKPSISDNILDSIDGSSTVKFPDHMADIEAHDTHLSGHIQAHDMALPAFDSFDPEIEEHPRFMMSNISLIPGEPLQYPSLMAQLSNVSRPARALRYNANSNYQNTACRENEADNEKTPTINAYSDLSSIYRMTSYFASTGNPFPHLVQESREDLGYTPIGYYANDNDRNTSPPIFSPGSSCTSY